MKKTLIGIVILVMVLAGCGSPPQATEQPANQNDSYPNPSYPSEPTGNLTPAQQAAIATLSETLNLSPGKITLISTETVEWRDGCLGVNRQGTFCTQAIVPGYKIILEADKNLYEVHTNKDGSAVVVVPALSDAGTLEQMAIDQLSSSLGLNGADVSVVSMANIEFTDSCLGVAMQEATCAQVITPGLIVILEADGLQYEYHISDDGTLIQPANLALTWKREGGIAGFCDNLTVFRSGEIYGNQCKSQPGNVTASFVSILSPDEQDQFTAWSNELGLVDLDLSDPKEVSDRMTVTLQFFGNGKGSLADTDKQDMLLWAQTVFQKLYN